MFKDKEKRAAYLRQYNAERREERNAYLRVWREKRRQQGIALLGGVCARCGSSENLHFDHRDRMDKVGAMANLWGAPEAVRLAELAKCQLLCKACHRAKTKECGDQAQNPGHHGAGHMYQIGKCRCDACVAWKRTDDRTRYRQRRKLAGKPYQARSPKPIVV